MNQAFVDYYRCPERFATFTLAERLSDECGYFRFGQDTICYGQSSSGSIAKLPTDDLYDVLKEITITGSRVGLPFDPTQVIQNLRCERYVKSSHVDGRRAVEKSFARSTYYLLRPLMPIIVRKYLQRIYLRRWNKIPFPAWPVDLSVEHILEHLMALLLKTQNRIPFIWPWPEGYTSCAIITHDVETSRGLKFCPSLMDINDSYGIKSSFQVIPEGRYDISEQFRSTIRDRGFELNIHDLNHDGNLFRDQEEFLRRAKRINQYAKDYGALGFRSGVLFRNPRWYKAFSFSYDMSIPNVAHLDPQRGGCCTVMPYFIGNILELPLTTTQDYSLFHILGDYSIELWKRQIDLIVEKHGLVSFNIHPDYIIARRARHTYTALLAYLSQLRSDGKLWITPPKEVNRWWRERSQMKLTYSGSSWQIEGLGKERARIAEARLDGDRVVYIMGQASRL